jgi:hypothetical protein
VPRTQGPRIQLEEVAQKIDAGPFTAREARTKLLGVCYQDELADRLKGSAEKTRAQTAEKVGICFSSYPRVSDIHVTGHDSKEARTWRHKILPI